MDIQSAFDSITNTLPEDVQAILDSALAQLPENIDLDSAVEQVMTMLPEGVDMDLVTQAVQEYLPADLNATMETIASGLESAIESVRGFLPEGMTLNGAIDQVVNLIPAELDFMTMMQFLLLFAGGTVLLGMLGRMILGRRSSLNHAISSAMGILFVYAMSIVIFAFGHWDLTGLPTSLPFVTFAGDYLVVFPLQRAAFTGICHEVLNLVILAFLVNLLDSFIPQGSNPITWFIFRIFSVALSLVLHLASQWAINTYLPDVLVTYAPIILLGVLAAMLLMGALNVVLNLLVTAVNPIFGVLYTFFFSNIVGKQLTKAVLTTAILTALVFLLGYFDYTIINISLASLTSYIPLAGVAAALWYLLGCLL